jgi:hypothetical protein
MTLRAYLAVMSLGALLAWTAVGLVVFSVSQPQASRLIVSFLYLAVYLAALGTFAVVGLGLRSFLLRRAKPAAYVAVAFRQAALIGLLIVGTLILSSQKMLNWWSGGGLVLCVTILEAVIISLRTKNHAPARSDPSQPAVRQ